MAVKMGIIGAGGIARVHLESCRRLGLEVVAIADINGKKVEEVAQKYEILQTFADYKKLLEKDLDGVIICTPNFLHKQQTVDALKAGKNVLCEKPLAVNGQEAEEMVRISEETGKILTVALCCRFGGEAQVLKKFVEEGELGEIYYAEGFYLRRRGIPDRGGWFTTKEKSGGGVLIDCGVHMLDLLLWLMGYPKPVSVAASTYAKFGLQGGVGDWPPPESKRGEESGQTFDVEDMVVAFIRLETGATINLKASWALNLEGRHGAFLAGTKGGARFPDPFTIYKESHGSLVDISPTVSTPNWYDEQMKHFVACMEKGSEPLVRAREALELTRIIDAIYNSAKTGKEASICS